MVDVEKIYLIYDELSRDDLLERCLGGYSQNLNESLNAVIWKLAPNHMQTSPETVNMASYFGAILYNEGYIGVVWLMKAMGIEIGHRCWQYAITVTHRREKQKTVR